MKTVLIDREKEIREKMKLRAERDEERRRTVTTQTQVIKQEESEINKLRTELKDLEARLNIEKKGVASQTKS